VSGKHICLANGWFYGGSCEPMQCADSMVPRARRVCTGRTDDRCNLDCDNGFRQVGQHMCQAKLVAPFPGAPLVVQMVFEGGECSALPEPEPEPTLTVVLADSPPPPPSPIELVVSGRATFSAGVKAAKFVNFITQAAIDAVAPVLNPVDELVTTNFSGAPGWSTSIVVQVLRFRQTVRSWVTLARDDKSSSEAGRDLSAGSVDRLSLQLALLATFGVEEPSQVQIGTVTPVTQRRRLRETTAHVNYTIVSGQDVSQVALLPDFAEVLAGHMVTASWTYGGSTTRLLPDGLIVAGNTQKVETVVEYEVQVPLDLAMHDSNSVAAALALTMNDGDAIGSALGAPVLRTETLGVRTIDLSPPSNRTADLHVDVPDRSGEVAAMTMALLLVLAAVGLFIFLLWRVCAPAIKGWRVAPVSRYEWSPPDGEDLDILGNVQDGASKKKLEAKKQRGPGKKWWQQDSTTSSVDAVTTDKSQANAGDDTTVESESARDAFVTQTVVTPTTNETAHT
jgi:hypothetical protein